MGMQRIFRHAILATVILRKERWPGDGSAREAPPALTTIGSSLLIDLARWPHCIALFPGGLLKILPFL
jgi:hypothetical protein